MERFIVKWLSVRDFNIKEVTKLYKSRKPTFYFLELSFCFNKLQDRSILSESQLSPG